MNYYYFKKSDLSFQRHSDKPVSQYEVNDDYFCMQHTLGLDELPSDWKSNPTVLMKILKGYRKTLYLDARDTIDQYTTEKVKTMTAQEWSDFQDYLQDLRDLDSADLTSKTLNTLTTVFPIQPGG